MCRTEAFASSLKDLTERFNVAIKAAWFLARYIMLAEVEEDQSWDPGPCVDQTFFRHVLLQCIQCTRHRPHEAKAVAAKALIDKHWDAFQNVYTFERPTIKSPGQLCTYQAEVMATAYKVNIKLRLGDLVRHAVNVLGNQAHHKREARNGNLESRAHLQSLGVCKRNIGRGLHTISTLPQLRPLEEVLASSNRFDDLAEESLWLDIAINPVRHMKTMVALNSLPGLRPFQCFPISTSWGPGYVQYDLRIIAETLQERSQKDARALYQDADAFWATVFKTSKKPWRATAGRSFSGSFATDGLGLTIRKAA